MDIKDLDKTQLILLSLLITFVVSIATGIVTVSLMQQMPKSVPQTINNVIQRTIEKVSAPTPTPADTTNTPPSDTKDDTLVTGDGNALVSIYAIPAVEPVLASAPSSDAKPLAAQPDASNVETPKALGQGVIISDIGLILVDANILPDEKAIYRVTLNATDFDAVVLEKFGNGFAILKISPKGTAKTDVKPQPTDTPAITTPSKSTDATPASPKN